jgi:peroxiredoxin
MNGRWIAVLCLCLCSCERQQEPPPPPPGAMLGPPGGGYGVSDDQIQFRDRVESNAEADADLLSLSFVNREGQPTQLKDLAKERNLILVMTRGYSGSICPYCTTQVSRMIANYDDFQKRNTDVVVIYPVETPADSSKVDDFMNRVISMLATKKETPFPVLLDVQLKAVDLLGIRKDLSKPATYILDGEGRVQFAYVGNTLADRPSVKALLEQVDKINGAAQRN